MNGRLRLHRHALPNGYWQAPPEALDRIHDDPLVPARELEPSVSEHLSRVVRSGLAMRPEERPQSAEAFQKALAAPAPPPPPDPPPPPPLDLKATKVRLFEASSGVRLFRASAHPSKSHLVADTIE